MFSIRSAKLTGTPDTSGWAQVHDFLPSEPEKIAVRGHLFAAIATKRIEEGVEAVTAGRELLGRLHEEYFGNLTEKPFAALKNAVQKVADEFKGTWGEVEIASCAVVNDVVYSAATGGSQVVINRDGALATILASTQSVISASGYPKAGDVILLATKTFFSKISPGVVKAALTAESPESGIETLAPMVHGGENSGGIGVIIVKFGQEPLTSSPIATLPEPPPRETVSNVPNKLSGFFSNIVKKIPQRRIYIKSEVENDISTQSKKLTFSVAIILLVILAVSIGFGVRQKRINDTKNKYQGILTEAENDVDQAISLASVSPDQSRELFLASEEKLKEIEALKVKDKKIDDLKQKINDSRAAVLGEYDASPSLFLDLSLLSSGFKGDALSTSNGSVFILDKNGKRIVSVAIATKKSKVVAGPGVIDEANDLASYQDNVYVLSGDGIYEVDSSKTKVIDKTWAGNAKIAAFAGNIYVMDKSANQIYRYAGTGSTFGQQQNWLSGSTHADFSGVTEWVIDGSVYALYPNSKVLKYSLGSPQSFSVTGTIPEIGSIDAIYADSDNTDIYLLDRAGKRVVVTDKKGKYVAQYANDAIGSATNLVVSEADKKIILLTGDKLSSIDIKHLN